jgi:hypothetical protein
MGANLPTAGYSATIGREIRAFHLRFVAEHPSKGRIV